MGMTIEDKDIELHIDRETLLQEYIPKANYETRLKVDIVAALKELQLEIEEIETGGDTWELAIKDDCNAVIQKKIDALEYDLERGNDGD